MFGEQCTYTADYGQRAFVGKVNMDQESPDFYKEETQQSLRDTRRYERHPVWTLISLILLHY